MQKKIPILIGMGDKVRDRNWRNFKKVVKDKKDVRESTKCDRETILVQLQLEAMPVLLNEIMFDN